MLLMFSSIKKKVINCIYQICKSGYFLWRDIIYFFVRIIACFFPLEDKVCASCFSGTKYGDNTKCIIEKVHDINPHLKICWLMDYSVDYELPGYVRGSRCFSDWRFLRRFWEYSTSKVIIDTHLLDSCFKKRKGQMFIETWHGGLGIKKIENDVDKYVKVRSHERKIANTVEQADVFISNSEHLTNIYKRAFGRTDNIWKTGYPKNDILVNITRSEVEWIRKKIRDYYHIDQNAIIITYAPTFRDAARTDGIFSMDPYMTDLTVLNAFNNYFHSENCHLIFKLHPFISGFSKQFSFDSANIHNGTDYPDMQELIVGSDALISDYSSCIFDAALFSLPCFIYVKDFEEYRKDRGTYFELSELPFPYAENIADLKSIIEKYDDSYYRHQWELFSEKVGLFEKGNASQVIAEYICAFCEK